jgi:hypothetical protein
MRADTDLHRILHNPAQSCTILMILVSVPGVSVLIAKFPFPVEHVKELDAGRPPVADHVVVPHDSWNICISPYSTRQKPWMILVFY